ncbi:hypothetical protein SmJEL517_g01926, partial [Synchytrium microbalum]
GAKAQQKRERNAKDAKTGPTSQLKANQASLTIQCKICLQTFMMTSSRTQLESHLNKHAGKEFAACFPNFTG